MARRKAERANWVWPTLWAISIFATSSGVVTTNQLSHAVSTVAGGKISESGFLHFWGVVWWIFVKGWHALEFALLFLLIRKAIPKSPSLALGLASLGAFFDEFHQLFVPSRGCRLSDVCIDCLGVLGAWVLTERSRYGKTTEASSWLTPLFERRWLMPLLAILWCGLVFWLSVCPFGLVTLHPSEGGLPRP